MIAGLALGACAVSPTAPVNGALHSDVRWSAWGETHLNRSNKVGEACSESWFGLSTDDDATVRSAALNGGIVKIIGVEHSYESYALGVYTNYCTIVYGN